MDINAMKQQARGLAKKARDILDAAQNDGNRDLTGEEEQEFDRLMEEHDTLQGRIEREERVRSAERAEERDPEETDGRTDPGGDGNRDTADEQQEAFRAYLRDGDLSRARALQMGNDPEGGFLVAPQQFVEQLIQDLDDEVHIRGLATTMTLTEGESLGVPTLEEDLEDPEWTSEIETGNEGDIKFGKRALVPNPLAKRVKISRTLLRRAALNPEEIVRARLRYRFQTAQERAFMVGDGNKKPLGLFVASSDGISTARDVPTGSTDGFTGDGLIDAKYTLKAGYHRRARWLFHRFAIRDIRKLKIEIGEGEGQYIWQPGLASDRPDTILDLPFILSEFAPYTVSNGNYVGMLADFSYYWIADALDMEVQRLVELYAEQNRVGFIGRLESDGMPVLEEAFVRIKVGNS